MAITSVEDIKKVLQVGYDPDHVRTMYRQMCYAFGDAWDKVSAPDTQRGRILECPDITVKFLEVGQSRRILNTSFHSLSSTMNQQPAPEIKGVGNERSEAIKQFLMARSEGEDCEGGDWGTEDAMAFLDGDNLGYGGVEIVLATNPETDLQRVGIRHVPATHVLYDRHERNPGRARWMAFIHHLAPDVAVAKYGKMAERFIQPMFDRVNGLTDPLESVRIVEVWTAGLGKADPTRTVLAIDLDGEVLEHGENPFECIPFAHYLHFIAPGMRRPVGKIALQMSTQEALNEVERHMRKMMRKASIDFADTNQVDPDDLQTYLDSGGVLPVKYNPSPNGPPMFRLPAAEAAQTTLAWSQMLERQFNTDSGTTDLERGNQLEQNKTLGEAQLVDARSSVNDSWSELQATLYHRRKYAKIMQIASKFDRDPIELVTADGPIVLNDPGNPASHIDSLYPGPLKFLVSTESLRKVDSQQEMAQKMGVLSSLGDLVQAGLADPEWWAKERIKAAGYDPEIAMPKQAPMPQDPAAQQAAMAQQAMQPPAA